MSKKTKEITKGELAIELLADIHRTFLLESHGKLTRKAWGEFSNSICSAIEKILEHDL